MTTRMKTLMMDGGRQDYSAAIYFDVENLLGGCHVDPDFIRTFSLKKTIDQVRGSGLVERFAISRAYANWSDARLNLLRGEIVELGIDPVQMVGFGRGAGRNTADIQLAIDVVEAIHTRLALKVFVIVSGDGAFSAVAKRLHEHGRQVVGCACRKATSRVFAAVCDSFVWLERPGTSGNGEAPEPSCRPEAVRTGPPQTTGPGSSAAGVRQALRALTADLTDPIGLRR